MRLFLVSLVLLAACAPQEQAFNSPNQAPRIEKNSFITSDNIQLPLRKWELNNPRAIVIAVHGFNEYSNAFTGMGPYFKKRGIATYAYDQRGFGGTPETGIWAGEDNLTRDIQDIVAVIKKRYPRTPIYLFGESMGGAVVMRAAVKNDLPIEGIILSAPAVWGGEHMPTLYRMLLWGMAHTMPGYKMTGQDLKIMASNNIEMLRAMGKDPLVIKATRVDAIYGLSGLMGDAYDSPPDIHKRVLLLYGYKDQVIPRAPIESIETRFSKPIDTIYYEDGFHMLTRDLQGKEVLADIVNWIRKPR